jgi:hypothetical protein
MMHEMSSDKDFLSILRQRATQKSFELDELIQESKRIQSRIENAKAYVAELNSFLEREGEKPVQIRETHKDGIGKPGNRSPDLPVRRKEWDGMNMNEIVRTILDRTGTKSFTPDDISKEVYEIQTDRDLRRVVDGIRTVLQRGLKAGYWDRPSYGKYRAQTPSEQSRLVIQVPS